MSRPEDWLVAIDDELCARLRWCTLCGARCHHLAWYGLWHGGGMTVATMLCERCHATVASQVALARLMEQRYRGGVGHGQP
jgi:hypothetical protein